MLGRIDMGHRIPTRIGKIEAYDPPIRKGHMYMWDLSFHGWIDDTERSEFWDWAFGPYIEEKETIEAIDFLLQRSVSSNFGGEFDQYLLLEGPLHPDEYLLIERYIEYCWSILPNYLEDRRMHPHSSAEERRRRIVI